MKTSHQGTGVACCRKHKLENFVSHTSLTSLQPMCFLSLVCSGARLSGQAHMHGEEQVITFSQSSLTLCTYTYSTRNRCMSSCLSLLQQPLTQFLCSTNCCFQVCRVTQLAWQLIVVPVFSLSLSSYSDMCNASVTHLLIIVQCCNVHFMFAFPFFLLMPIILHSGKCRM